MTVASRTVRRGDAGIGARRRVVRVAARVLASVLALSACRAGGSAGVRVVLHDSGSARDMSAAGDAAVAAVVETAERAVGAGETVLRLAVSEQMLDDIRSRQRSVEIDYGEVRTFRPAAMQGRELPIRRMLIPLSGQLAGQITTIFMDPGGGYEAGPLRAAVSTGELETAVSKAAGR